MKANKIIKQLKKIITEHPDKSISQFAKKIGTSRQNARYLFERDDIKLSRFIELCEYLEISPAVFFTDFSERATNVTKVGYLGNEPIDELLKELNALRKAVVKDYLTNKGIDLDK